MFKLALKPKFDWIDTGIIIFWATGAQALGFWSFFWLFVSLLIKECATSACRRRQLRPITDLLDDYRVASIEECCNGSAELHLESMSNSHTIGCIIHVPAEVLKRYDLKGYEYD